MIWFISDTHFGHTRLLESPERQGLFRDIEDMDARIIDGINMMVRPNDELYHLGDFCWNAPRAGHYRARLKVRKLHVIRGNHDRPSLSKHCSTFQDMRCIKFRFPEQRHPVKVHMLHYPMLEWDAYHRGGVHLYGHCHSRVEVALDRLFPGRRAMDVSVDNLLRVLGCLRPISLDEVIERLQVTPIEHRLPSPFEETSC